MTIRVGGVPENVNIPWYVAIETKLADSVSWRSCPGGTGEMTRLLEEREIDLALVLTEGAISYIEKGGSGRIVGTYVETPLIWGVHTSADAEYDQVDDLAGQRFAVSRLGSGSHLMAFVLAAQRKWAPEDAPLIEIAGGLDGALEKFGESAVDGFLWEKYMTQPFVDSGVLKRIGECRAPWPAFSIAATPEMLQRSDEVRKVIAEVAAVSEEFQNDEPRFIGEIERRFSLETDDIEA